MGNFCLCLSFLRKALLTVFLVLFYYCFSIGITFYNKWVMRWFHYPLFMTLVHLAMIFIFSAISRTLTSWYTGKPRICLSWELYLKRVAATALTTALDIGLSNWSFMFITVSLYTMTKSTAVLFILFFAVMFKLEELRSWLLVVVLLIAGGLFMFTYKSTQFNVKGFILVLIASFLGGIRWTLTQILTQKADLGLSLSASEKLFRYHETSTLLHTLHILAGGGFLAFGLCFSEFLLVSKTSSLTLSIAGIFKEVCILVLASHLMGDQLTVLNWLGFVMCLSGISLHVALKAIYSEDSSNDKKIDKLHDMALTDIDTELLLRNGQANESEEEDVQNH
ncbi:solute carrier family 35 member C2 isoform X2 [Hypanus sabinus]|uniref:solute carrier family 35 member C2 isoform X2 n=1 Tax=Hypanus sabinus TaxID=79690 RepID=UPI0028C3770C|nr:solute carrier family 35 member C2 isoform X2 [Hypanus sabinus]